MNQATLTFAEHVGRFWESSGGNRGQGRLLGWLLTCDPPHQSLAQLRETLHMSAGAVSTNTRVLEGLGLVERITFPRDRATYYRMAPNAWDYVLASKLEAFHGLRAVADEGMAVLGDAPPSTRGRLDQMVEMLDFMDIEFPKLIELWHQRKDRQ